jgi:hypothetical protein
MSSVHFLAEWRYQPRFAVAVWRHFQGRAGKLHESVQSGQMTKSLSQVPSSSTVGHLMEVGTRRVVHCNITAHQTGAWTLQRLRGAIPSDHSYRFLLHDRDAISAEVDQQLKAFGLLDCECYARPRERLLRTFSGKHTPGVFGFHDSTGRETSAQNPSRMGDSL